MLRLKVSFCVMSFIIRPVLTRSDHPHDRRYYRRVTSAIGNSKSMMCVKEWLQECSSSHQKCRSTPSAKPPKRLLHLDGLSDDPSSSVTVYLIENPPSETEYVCLSHCWGSLHRPIELLLNNKDSFKVQIFWADIPLLFRDAIITTLTLGFKYIWIDSLCIIQDDVADWQTQALDMVSTYQQSALTIAAVSAKDSASAMFTKVHENDFGTEFTSTTGTHIIRKPILHPIFSSQPYLFNRFPLLLRGWVYQERMLSPKVLYFSDQELSWECRSLKSCECHCEPQSWDHDIKKQFYDQIIVPDKSLTFDETAILWLVCIEQFSKLEVTRHEDRLLAVAGIAKAFAAAHTPLLGKYLAGTWSNLLPRGLSWYSSGPATKRPSQSGVPTWSWASMQRRVIYLDQHPQPHFTIKVLHVEVFPFQNDPFGILEGGRIVVQGPTFEGTLQGKFRFGLADGKEWYFQADDYFEFVLQDPPIGSALRCIRIEDSFAMIVYCSDANQCLYKRFGCMARDRWTRRDSESLDIIFGKYNELAMERTTIII
jgi:Heterokaryon incompatibility protein (HET)